MEPVTLSIMAAAAGKALDVLLGDSANRMVAAIVGGVIGNRADGLVCQATRASWSFFRNLRTEDPALNHDLERATREAYLLATLELIRQAEHLVALMGSPLLQAGDADALATLRRGVEMDLRDVANTLPEPIPDAHLFLVDPAIGPADRLSRMRDALRANLRRDTARWLPGREVPAVVTQLLASGWVIDTKHRAEVSRDWYSLIALAFVEKLKTSERLARVFEARMLAQIAAFEPAAAPIATFGGFSAQLDVVTIPLQRIEDQLGIVGRDLTEIKADVREIKDTLALTRRAPRALWAAATLLTAAAVVGLATGGGPRFACGLPGVRTVCVGLGIGGVPSEGETRRWTSRVPGDCSGLRTYLSEFPSGAYAEEAGRRLAARRTENRDFWHPEDKTHVFTVRTSDVGHTSEQAARDDAQERATTDAQEVCLTYQAGDYRLVASRFLPREWRCVKVAGAVRCGFDGTITCKVESRRVDMVEICD